MSYRLLLALLAFAPLFLACCGDTGGVLVIACPDAGASGAGGEGGAPAESCALKAGCDAGSD